MIVADLGHGALQDTRHLLEIDCPIEDVLVLEVAGRGDVVEAADDFGVLSADGRRDLLGRPHEELALDTLAVGVLRRVEAAVRDASSRAERSRASRGRT